MADGNGIGLPFPWGIIPAERTLRRVSVPDPAAGADWSRIVPGGVLWLVQLVRCRLVTAAAVANRVPRLIITDGEARVFEAQWSGVVPAGTTVGLGAGVGHAPITDLATQTNGSIGLPDALLQGAWVIGTATVNVQAADQYSQVELLVAEYSLRGLERGRARYLEALVEAGA